MSVAIRQIHPVFVGEERDRSDPGARRRRSRPSRPGWTATPLVFRDQKITDEQQMVFSRNFGPLEDARGGTSPGRRIGASPWA